MKLKTLFVITAMCGLSIPASANPFGSFWRWITGAPGEPFAVVDGVLQPRNDNVWRGPTADKSEWNIPSVLEADITSVQLANVKDPADFLDARVRHASPPTYRRSHKR